MEKLTAVFLAVFVAEMGDKTQLATLLFAADRGLSPLLVFLAAAAALVATTAIAVAVGAAAQQWLDGVPLKLIAGAGFVAIGLWTIKEHFAA